MDDVPYQSGTSNQDATGLTQSHPAMHVAFVVCDLASGIRMRKPAAANLAALVNVEIYIDVKTSQLSWKTGAGDVLR